LKLLVYSTGDPAGVNIAAQLQKKLPFSEYEFNSRPALKCGDVTLQGIDGRLVYLDIPLLGVEWILCLSRHASVSGKPCLTSHAPGNLTSNAELGGNPNEVGISNPALQTSLIKELFRSQADGGLTYQVTVEATHHGPTSLAVPVAFVGIGSDEAAWKDETLGEAVASAVHRAISSPLPLSTGALAVGGGHYSEKFTKLMQEGKHEIGHIVPKYAMDEKADSSIFKSCIERTRGGCSSIVIDWRGVNSASKEALRELAESLGIELIRV
jgi:D-aminoacyl-tRNA deacylase